MAMIGGDCRDGSGLAGKIADKLRTLYGDQFQLNDATVVNPNTLGAAIVEYIQEAAEVETDVSANVPTAIPVAVTPGTGIGATTAPSTATQSKAPGKIK